MKLVRSCHITASSRYSCVLVLAGISLRAAAAPAAAEAGDTGTPLLGLLAPLLLIVAAAAVATWLLLRWKGSVVRRDGPLQLVQILALGPRERLALVRAGGRYLVVGVAPGGISRIAELDSLDEAAASLQQAGTDSGRQPPTA